ncbi:splicing factor 3A subunit 1-like, partial [Sceloporus undulatus]|uniref:splicing factor 3A subunit 1-like n=1 Tax=Sceloporus undulatus TaxID=8520 RepID=UPI001C4B914E
MARTQQAAQANITLQEQIEAIHKAKGLVPEDDSKEKIGPSKPNEMLQQQPPPPPSSAPNMPTNAPLIVSVPRPPSMPPPVRTTVVSAVPVMPHPPMTSVVRLPPGSVIATLMPPIIHAPRINVMPMPPLAPPIMAPRPPPMIVPTGYRQGPVSAPGNSLKRRHCVLKLTFRSSSRFACIESGAIGENTVVVCVYDCLSIVSDLYGPLIIAALERHGCMIAWVSMRQVSSLQGGPRNERRRH